MRRYEQNKTESHPSPAHHPAFMLRIRTLCKQQQRSHSDRGRSLVHALRASPRSGRAGSLGSRDTRRVTQQLHAARAFTAAARGTRTTRRGTWHVQCMRRASPRHAAIARGVRIHRRGTRTTRSNHTRRVHTPPRHAAMDAKHRSLLCDKGAAEQAAPELGVVAHGVKELWDWRVGRRRAAAHADDAAVE